VFFVILVHKSVVFGVFGVDLHYLQISPTNFIPSKSTSFYSVFRAKEDLDLTEIVISGTTGATSRNYRLGFLQIPLTPGQPPPPPGPCHLHPRSHPCPHARAPRNSPVSPPLHISRNQPPLHACPACLRLCSHAARPAAVPRAEPLPWPTTASHHHSGRPVCRSLPPARQASCTADTSPTYR
jgi:hypothetical protein